MYCQLHCSSFLLYESNCSPFSKIEGRRGQVLISLCFGYKSSTFVEHSSTSMAAFRRSKRVTDLLGEKVKAQLRGEALGHSCYASSGSEHEAADPSCFSGSDALALLLDDKCSLGSSIAVPFKHSFDDDNDDETCVDFGIRRVRELVAALGKEDVFMVKLLSDVSVAIELFTDLKSGSCSSARSGYRRAVMRWLRVSTGYDAALCKTRWESDRNITAGSYEFIDVVGMSPGRGTPKRYIIDLDFASEFEVARATDEYSRTVAELPTLMVGSAEDVRRVVRAMGVAAKRSLSHARMHIPPWRKKRYMLAKWLGPYKRTTNALPSSSGASLATASTGGTVECRTIGFQAAAYHAMIPP